MMPVKKWDMERIARFGEQWYEPQDRKIVLNFALARGVELDPDVLARHFSPHVFMVKLTPVNPTDSSVHNGLETVLSGSCPDSARTIVDSLSRLGFDCVVSIGDEREIAIGSNCGQAATVAMKKQAEAFV